MGSQKRGTHAHSGSSAGRLRGQVATAEQVGANGHVCWGFTEQADFHRAAVEFLAEGRRLGQRLLYISDDGERVQRSTLAPLGDVGAMIDRGDLRIARIADVYDAAAPLDPCAQLAGYAAETERACAAGYAGFRVAADATPLVLDAARHDSHLRWENVADRYMASQPMAGFCAYNERAVPAELLADLQCLHPASHDGATPAFRLSYHDMHTLTLEGEIDLFNAQQLDRLLGIVGGEAHEPPAIDLGTLRFIDHHGITVLAQRAREHRLEIHNMPTVAQRLYELLGITAR